MRGTTCMRLAGAVAISLSMTPAFGQSTLKIGVLLPYSGQFADTGTQLDNGIKLYLQRHGDSAATRKIEIVRKDVGGVAPDIAKRLAQELVVRDKVDILAGFVLTPNALAAADVSAQARKLMVIMNAGTSIITTKSPYSTRTSITLPQAAGAMAAWSRKSGIRNVYTMVSDFGPGHDAEGEFQQSFKQLGGVIVGSLRFPVANPDFSAFVRRVKDLSPEALFVFMPAGAQPAAFGRALAEQGIETKTTKVLGTGDLTSEQALKSMGDAGLGIITAWNFDHNLELPASRVFVKEFNDVFKRNPDFMSVGGYDGMHLIFEALKKTAGNADGEALIAAAKGMQWQSPRGPIMIDPQTRDVVQDIYIRRVEKVEGEPRNVTIDKVENVKDPVLARTKN
jgi:branched-chain amino acid transport system substrate-binding protein